MAVTLATARSERGRLTLRRLDDGRLELRANGVFVMDDRESTSERALATLALRAASERAPSEQAAITRAACGVAISDPLLRMLVGGLGLGCTAAELLASPDLGLLVVAEIEPALVDWAGAGLLGPSAARVVGDPRVEVVVDDVLEVVGGQRDLDAILLDVDNGPQWASFRGNARLYTPAGLASAQRALTPGGILAVWSGYPADAFLARLREAGFTPSTVALHEKGHVRARAYVGWKQRR
jgi:spermidine synthase